VTASRHDDDVTYAAPRTGILMVRMWWEADAPEGFRARITHTLDSAEPEQETASVGGADGLCAVVRSWVEDFVATVPSAAGRAER
jgi:hypothetical protein